MRKVYATLLRGVTRIPMCFAPEILGFERLSGGLSAVVMEKIDMVDRNNIRSFPEAKDCREIK